MKKIEPVAWRYAASGYKKWHYSEQFPSGGLRDVASIGKLDALWTDDALQAVAEAVYGKVGADLIHHLSDDGFQILRNIDIAAIINQLKGSDMDAIASIATRETDETLREQYQQRGREDYLDGRQFWDCPCDAGSLAAKWWHDGYAIARAITMNSKKEN